MKRLQEKVKVMMNSTYSSLLDFGLTNSQFADLSSVSEDEAEENKGTQYQNLGEVDSGNQHARASYGLATSRADHKQPGRRTIVVQKTNQDVKSTQKKRYPLASPFELAPKAQQHPKKDIRSEESEILQLGGQNDPISKCVQHYFIDKKHKPASKQQPLNTSRISSESKSHQKKEFTLLSQTGPANRKMNESFRRTTKSAKRRQRYSIKSPSKRSPIKNTDRSMVSDQKSHDSNITIAQIKRMRDISTFDDSIDSSMILDRDQNSGNSQYSLTLKVNYKTEFGQEIAVIGSIPQLGSWDKCKALRMKWTEGHNWVAQNIIIDQSQGDPTHFMYKYALLRKGRFEFFEKGFNRIADVKLLKPQQESVVNRLQLMNNQMLQDCNQNQGFVYDSYPNAANFGSVKVNPIKKVQIDDCWEYFHVNFQIFNPTLDFHSKILINGDHNEIGNWSRNGPKKMDKRTYRSNWLMKEKYGQKVKFSQFSCKFQNNSQSMPIKMRYNYSIQSRDGQIEWEREPCREMEIQDPHSYNGQPEGNRKNAWLNRDKVWVVNGEVNKLDSNFRVQFKQSRIGQTNIYVGNCPITSDDVIRLSHAGVTAVLSLVEDQHSYEKVKQLYQQNNIDVYRNCLIPEFNDNIDRLSERLLQAAKELDSIRKQHPLKKILVHCTAGITRSPTLAVLYLCLYCQIDFWKQPVDVYQLVKDSHPISFPNMRVVFKILSRNRALQYNNCLLLQAEFQKRAAEEQQRQQVLIQQAQEMQEKLDNLQSQLAERLQKRKIDRQIRLKKFKKDTNNLNKQQKQIEEQRQKLKQIQNLKDESVDVLNKTNELLQKHIQDQSILLEEVSDYKEDMRMYTQRMRKSINFASSKKNISPGSKKKQTRKSQAQSKKNKSCTPTRIDQKQSSRRTVPVQRLNFGKSLKNKLVKQKSEDEVPDGLRNSKDLSQNDNSFLNILQKSQIMASDIGSKELEGIEPPTKSFDEVQDKSDISANNRSVKFRASIFNNHTGFISSENSPIRAKHTQIVQNPTEVSYIKNDVEVLNADQFPDEDQFQDTNSKPANKNIFKPKNNLRSTLPNTAVASITASQDFQDQNNKHIDSEQANAKPDLNCSPVFENDSNEDNLESTINQGSRLYFDQKTLPHDIHIFPNYYLATGNSRQPLENQPNQVTIQNIEKICVVHSPIIEEDKEQQQRSNQLQLFNKAVELSNKCHSDREDSQQDQKKEPVTPYLYQPNDAQNRIDGSPSVRAYNFLRETLGSIRNTNNELKQLAPVIDLQNQLHLVDDVNMGSPLFKQAINHNQISKSNQRAAEAEKSRQKTEFDDFEHDHLRDHIILIDQIQKRSSFINEQIKEQMKQKKEHRENSADYNGSRKSPLSKLNDSPPRVSRQVPEVSPGLTHQKRNSSPCQQNNTSHMDRSVVVSEARELLNQNKQDLSILRDSPAQRITVGSFLSQNSKSIDQKVDANRYRDSFRSTSLQNRTATNVQEKESQFKIDAKLPLDDFDKVKKDLKLQRRLATLGISKQQLIDKCKSIFDYESPPIPFLSRPSVYIDQKIDMILNELQSSIPVINVRANIYLVGIYKFEVQLEQDQVVIKNNQCRSINLKEYLVVNEEHIKQMLVMQTLLCKQNINYVVNSHMIDQSIPELQHFDHQFDDETATQQSGKYPYRASYLNQLSNQNTPIPTNCLMTPNKRDSPQVIIEDSPEDQIQDDLQDNRQRPIQKKTQTLQSSPHSRNQRESLNPFNSTPVKQQLKLNRAQANEDSRVHEFKPKGQSSIGYNKTLKTKKRISVGHKQDCKTITQFNLSNLKLGGSGSSLQFDSYFRNSKLSRGRHQRAEQQFSSASAASSKKMSASQMQIKLAKELAINKKHRPDSHRNDLTSADTTNEVFRHTDPQPTEKTVKRYHK